MARETTNHKKTSFDDELGDDFLSSWKPSKSLAGLDFEDDEPVAKKGRGVFSLAKMDASFDFDFDGGLNALSKFNVDMSDLDLPSTREKTMRKKDSNREKEPNDNQKKKESKFSFNFNGFDELDLDEAIKTKNQKECPLQSKNEERDFSPISTLKKSHENAILESLSEKASESFSVPGFGKSMNKESSRTCSESADDQGNSQREFGFSDKENSSESSAQKLLHPVECTQEQISKNADSCSSPDNSASRISRPMLEPVSPNVDQAGDSVCNKSGTSSHCSMNSHIEVPSTSSAHKTTAVQLHGENEKNAKAERGVDTELDAEAGKKFASGMDLDGSSSDCEQQKSTSNCEDSLKGSTRKGTINESTAPKLFMETSCSETLMLRNLDKPSKTENDDQQNSSMCHLKLRQEFLSDGNQVSNEDKVAANDFREEKASTIPLQSSNNEPVEKSPTNKSLKSDMQEADNLFISKSCPLALEVSPSGRPAKRKFMGAKGRSDSPEESSDDISKGVEMKNNSDSATAEEKCKDLHRTSEGKNQNAFVGGTAAAFLADRSSGGGLILQKTTAQQSSVQPPRLQLGSSEYHLSCQKQTSLVKAKSTVAHLQNTAALAQTPTVLGGLRRPPWPSKPQPKSSPVQLYVQLNLTKDASSRRLLNTRPSTEKQLQGSALPKTANLSFLSKTRATGALRETCGKTFKLDVPMRKLIPLARKDAASLKPVQEPDKNRVVESPDAEMVDTQNTENLEAGDFDKERVHANTAEIRIASVQNAENLNRALKKEMVQLEGPGTHLSISGETDSIIEKSEYYASRLDQLLKELKIKQEEAMDLRVRAMVVNNSFLMLNNPIDDEKIRKIEHYVREKLDFRCSPVTQRS